MKEIDTPEEWVMPEPPEVEGVEWTKNPDGSWSSKSTMPPTDKRPPTDAELFDDKCTAMDYFNRYYRND